MYAFFPLNDVIARNAQTVAGNASTLYTSSATAAKRRGVIITNCSTAANLYVCFYDAGLAAPVPSATNFDLFISGTQSATIDCTNAISFSMRNDTGAATTIDVMVTEVA
jgi:hypothetical protein